jgi:hypothetical protein
MNVSELLHDDQNGLARALAVSRSGIRTPVSEGDEKILGFFIQDGECDARIADRNIEARFSWHQSRKPSTYFGRYAPGLISQLMDLGGVSSVIDETEFAVGPGIAGSGAYRFSFEKKWIWIRCADEGILIRVREQRQDLRSPLTSLSKGPPCPFCGQPIATDKAKQCLNCGADWHDNV